MGNAVIDIDDAIPPIDESLASSLSINCRVLNPITITIMKGNKTLSKAIQKCFFPDRFNKPRSIFTPLAKTNNINPITTMFLSTEME